MKEKVRNSEQPSQLQTGVANGEGKGTKSWATKPAADWCRKWWRKRYEILSNQASCRLVSKMVKEKVRNSEQPSQLQTDVKNGEENVDGLPSNSLEWFVHMNQLETYKKDGWGTLQKTVRWFECFNWLNIVVSRPALKETSLWIEQCHWLMERLYTLWIECWYN